MVAIASSGFVGATILQLTDVFFRALVFLGLKQLNAVIIRTGQVGSGGTPCNAASAVKQQLLLFCALSIEDVRLGSISLC